MYSTEMNKFKTQFLELIPIAKQMKKHIVTFQDGRVLGTDETCASLSIVYYDDEKFDLFKLPMFRGLSLTFILNDLIAYLKVNNIMDHYYEINQYGICYSRNNLDNQFGYSKVILDMEMRCRYYMTDSIHTIDGYNIREDQLFNQALELKKKDGSTMYRLDNRYFMSTFSSIHPVTKSDKMTVDIFELSDMRSFLSKFTITKKNCIIEEYIRYRNI